MKPVIVVTQVGKGIKAHTFKKNWDLKKFDFTMSNDVNSKCLKFTKLNLSFSRPGPSC